MTTKQMHINRENKRAFHVIRNWEELHGRQITFYRGQSIAYILYKMAVVLTPKALFYPLPKYLLCGSDLQNTNPKNKDNDSPRS